jgi:hypothetical protein
MQYKTHTTEKKLSCHKETQHSGTGATKTVGAVAVIQKSQI